MDAQSDLLASRYAKALFQYAQCPFEERILFKLEMLSSFLQLHQTQLVGVHKATLERIVALYALEKIKLNLVLNLLEKRKALHIFGGVVKTFLELYKEHYSTMVCTMRSSHPLTVEQRTTLVLFIEQMTGKRVFYSFVHDRGLIAGVRIEGDTIVWEQSISRELRLIEQSQ